MTHCSSENQLTKIIDPFMINSIELNKIVLELLDKPNHYYIYKVISTIVGKIEEQNKEIERFTKSQITEETLKLLPFFSSKKISLLKPRDLHKSY